MVYSKDIRWRVIVHRFHNHVDSYTIARLLHISVSTVRRIIARFTLTGSVSIKPMGRPRLSSLLTRPQLLILFEYVLSNETAYLKEMSNEVYEVSGSRVSIQSMHYLLSRFGYFRKRVCFLLTF